MEKIQSPKNNQSHLNNISMAELIANAKNDPTLLSTINIDDLLDSLEDENTDYLQNKSLKSISNEVFQALYDIGCREEQLNSYCEKLIGYRLVNEVYELHKGKLIKTIRLFDNNNNPITPKLRMHGKVSNIKFMDNGTHVVCMMFSNGSYRNQYVQYKFDEYLTFQKLSDEEQLILMAYDLYESQESK